jgi:hypothetical protein
MAYFNNLNSQLSIYNEMEFTTFVYPSERLPGKNHPQEMGNLFAGNT